LTFCSKVRSEPATADLPIIVLSGKTHLSAVEAGLSAGADKFLPKPVAMNDLFENIHKALHGGFAAAPA